MFYQLLYIFMFLLAVSMHVRVLVSVYSVKMVNTWHDADIFKLS